MWRLEERKDTPEADALLGDGLAAPDHGSGLPPSDSANIADRVRVMPIMAPPREFPLRVLTIDTMGCFDEVFVFFGTAAAECVFDGARLSAGWKSAQYFFESGRPSSSSRR